ncbi:hypothetical protein RQ832_21380, partial [Roseomonas sp. DSM 102946]|nr:hypothetical protein [Roseomonas sp. DSM 102946]
MKRMLSGNAMAAFPPVWTRAGHALRQQARRGAAANLQGRDRKPGRQGRAPGNPGGEGFPGRARA